MAPPRRACLRRPARHRQPPLLDFQPFDRDPTRQNRRYPFRGYFAKETPRIKGINPPSLGVSSGLRFLSFENVFPIGFIQNTF